jgi:hypothetical protein
MKWDRQIIEYILALLAGPLVIVATTAVYVLDLARNPEALPMGFVIGLAFAVKAVEWVSGARHDCRRCGGD